MEKSSSENVSGEPARQEAVTVQTKERDSLHDTVEEPISEITGKFSVNMSCEPEKQEHDTVQTMEMDSLEARVEELGSEITGKFSDNMNGEHPKQEPVTVQTMEMDSLEARVEEPGSEIPGFSENVSDEPVRQEPDTVQTMETDSLQVCVEEPDSGITGNISENVSGEPAKQAPETLQTMETDSLEARVEDHGSEIPGKFSENVSGETARQEPDTVRTIETDSLQATVEEPGSEISGKFSDNENEPTNLESDAVQTIEMGSLVAGVEEPGFAIPGKFSESMSGEPTRLELDAVHQPMETDLLESRLKEPGSEITEKSRVNVGDESAGQEPVQIMGKDSLQAGVEEPGSEIAWKCSITNDVTTKSNCGYLRHRGCNPESINIIAENKVSESGMQEPHLESNELTAFSEDLTTNSTCQVSCPIEDLKVDGFALDQLEPQSANENINPTSEQLEPIEKDTITGGQFELTAKDTIAVEQLDFTEDTIENPSMKLAVGNEEDSRPLDNRNGIVSDAIGSASSTIGKGDDEALVSLDKSDGLGLPPDSQSNSIVGNLVSSHRDGTENPSIESIEPTQEGAFGSTTQSGLGDIVTPLQSRKRKSSNGTSVTSIRVLRSRTKEKPETPESNNAAAEVADDDKKKRKMKKKKMMSNNPRNEFSRIRNQLRYLLHRIKYEQNLIDAYSAEGWKGQSLEKIKPEKELQRARSHIIRYKLKIRELLHHLDLSLTEGKIPESLFDSEGEIDSEDIFCAKCGSKDLPDNNDIILCDGACERGFHQFCLEPPLLKEDIPPGDEGWLCPACDCKLDCFDLLSDFHGINLSVADSWEKVFPEAASGNTLEDGSGLPSDDSEDDDYDPDKPELEEKSEEDESSSDDSDYQSASDGLAASAAKEPYLGLPSEDSEDDDYDPDAPDRDEHVNQESSSSDFSSDSEDLEALTKVTSLVEDQGQTSHDRGKLKVGRVENKSLRHELSYLLDSNEAPVSGKRHVERLDYKRLHDETYGNVSSDTSDEDFEKTPAGGSRKKRSDKKSPTVEKGEDLEPEDCYKNASEHTTKNAGKRHVDRHNLSTSLSSPSEVGSGSKKRSGKKSPTVEKGEDLEPEDCNKNASEHTTKNPGKRHGDRHGDRHNSSTSLSSPSEVGSGSKSNGRAYKKLGEVVTQRLFQLFEVNQYPKRPEKENLAKELGLTIQQVSKWFENARWSYRHSATMGSNANAGGSTVLHTSSPQSSQKSPEVNTPVKASKTANVVGAAARKSTGRKSGTPIYRKRKGIGDQTPNETSSKDKKPKENSLAGAPSSQQLRRSRRLQSGNS